MRLRHSCQEIPSSQCEFSQVIVTWPGGALRHALTTIFLLFAAASLAAQVSVPTAQYENGRTGQDTNETILTPSNVNSVQFGKLFSQAVVGQIYAQPLYIPNLAINGVIHNVVFVATENDSVYAFDADNKAGTNVNPLWQANLIDTLHGAARGASVVTSAQVGCTDLQPIIGITATPVIDPTTNTMYVEAKSAENGGYVHRLHALDITTGAEKSPGPVVIDATVSGTGDGSIPGPNGNQLVFSQMALTNHSRPGLLLSNGTVYIAFASHCDINPYHGWLFAYSASTFAQQAVFVTTANGGQGGIWMSGQGIAADASGNIFLSTGNGSFDTANTPATMFGDSIVKLALSGNTLSVLDYFTPYDQANLSFNDADLGSGGVLLLPDQPGSHPHLLVEAGKEGTIYLVDRDQMTTNNIHYCSSGCNKDTAIVQELQTTLGSMWATPSYWNGNVYFWGDGDQLKQYSLTNGLLSSNPVAIAPPSGIALGTTPAISSNGTANGILWAIRQAPNNNSAILFAFDATNVAHEFYDTTQAQSPPNRDLPGDWVKFTVPVVTNGKVYVGTATELDVYGLLGSVSPPAATPQIAPPTENFTGTVSVSITDSTAGAVIYYTTDGGIPVPGQGTTLQYSTPFTVTKTTTVNAIASASGFSNSLVATATYTFVVPATVASVSPNTGTTSGGTSVTITGTNFVAGATVTFGSNAAANVVVVSSTQITATTPAGSAGAVTVTVTNPGVASGSLANGYTYVVIPTVSSISPNNGPVAGGTSVTITGTNFAAGATVTFGGTAATNVVVVSGTQITAIAPAHAAGAVTVTVTANGQSGSLANGFTYNAAVPISFGQVAAATPQSPTATVPVTFPGPQTAGDLNIVVVGWNDTTSAVQSVRDSAGNTYNLAIGPTVGTALQQSIYYAANIVGGSNTVTVTFNQPAASPDVRILEYRGVTTLDAKAGASGNSATTNSGTAATTSGNELIFGANTVFTSNTAPGAGFTSRIITSPDGDIAEDQVVNTAGNNSATAALNSAGPWVMQMVTFSAATGPVLTVSSVSPNTGTTTGGTSVTITGTNFAAGATVAFGSNAATNVVVVSGTQITATAPAGSAGAVTVTVTVNGQAGSLTNGFTYVVPATVTSLSPKMGTTAGGTAVTIMGTNFAAGAAVTFGSNAATNVVVVSGTQITATTPVGSPGAVTVTVTNPGVPGGSLANGYTYVVVPTVTSVSPNNGPIAGGSPVTITGTNFVAGATVTFGGNAATNVVVVNGTQITATTPPGSVGAVTVTVTVNGQAGSLASGFTYNSAVAISFGQVAAATPQSPTATVPVAFPGPQTAGDLNIVVVGWNDATSSVASVKDSAGNTYNLGIGPTVGTALQQSIYYAANIVGGSNTVTVTFNQAAVSPDVRILEYRGVTTLDAKVGASGNSTAANSGGATTTSANELIFGANTVFTLTGTAGSGFTSRMITSDGDIAEDKVVTTAGSNSANATLTSSGPWVMQMVTFSAVTGPVPTVSSVSPNNGPVAGGTAETITGTNFATGATVTFGTNAATNVVVVSGTQITATTPAGSAGAATVTVTVNGQAGSLANGFTYIAPPTVTSVSPSTGTTAGGTSVTITGTNFGAGATVTFGSNAATNVVVVSSTQITATTPAGSIGAVTVTVTANGQSGSLTNGFTYVVPATVTSVSPNTGATVGGTSVTLTGMNFAAGATVTFGGSAATGVVVVSSTQITAKTPAGSAGAVTVTVTNPGVSGGSLANGFTYVVIPTVSSVSPSTGTTAGGTSVTITGTNFAAGATVTIGSNAATNVVVVSGTQITATTPAGSAGAVTVTVTVNGQAGSLAGGFTYNAAVAISFGQVAAATPQSSTATVPVTFPGPQTAGDLNIVVVGWNDTTSAVQTVKDSAGNTYNLAIGPTVGTALQQSIYYAANIVGGSNTVTVTFNQPAASPDVRILEYRGVTTLDAKAGASGNSRAANSGAATTTSANELIFGANTVFTLTTAAGTGYTSRIITSPDGDIAEDKVVTTAGSNSANATLTSTGPWVMQMVTFK
jgi:IPT/TIG domain/Chitobiase/beta-hexosaminidase C-terminal domain